MHSVTNIRALVVLSLAAVLLPAAKAGAAAFTGNYAENFDSLGTAGDTAPDGWAVYSIPGSNTGWTTDMSPDTVGGGIGYPTLLSAAPPTSTTKSAGGYNAASSATATDRALGTSPTGTNGTALELVLTNNTGAALDGVNVGYDIRRLQVGSGGPDELPGYWLFYSMDNGYTWTNVAALNPSGTGAGGTVAVPNTVGVTNVPKTGIAFASPWADGTDLVLRWVDDNGIPSSPDEFIALDNVSVGVPEPAVTSFLLIGGALLALRRARQ
jgi:hypothetical protein